MASNTVDTILAKFGERIGKPYRFWWNWMDPNDVGCMAPPWEDDIGYNCTSVYNSILGEMLDEGWSALSPIGGTGYWNAAVGGHNAVYEQPNVSKNYPPGSFGVTPYISDNVQGHVQMVATFAPPSGGGWGEQYIAQSDHADGNSADFSIGWPGPNWNRTMGWTWSNIDFPTWIGLIDGIPVLDGFPGYNGYIEDIAKWTAEQMEFFGLPPQLFVQCSIPELTTIWSESGREKYPDIRQIPGYSYAVDHTSYGPAQQLWDYYPFPWDFATSVWSFAAMALRADICPNPMPDATDADGCAEWIADIQRPYEAYRGRYRYLDDGIDTHAWAMSLIGDGKKTPSPPPPPDPIKKLPNWYSKGYVDLSKVWQPGFRGGGFQRPWGDVQEDGTIVVREWDDQGRFVEG